MKDATVQVDSTGLLRAEENMLRKPAFMLRAAGNHQMGQCTESTSSSASTQQVNNRHEFPFSSLNNPPSVTSQTQNCGWAKLTADHVLGSSKIQALLWD